MSLVEALAEIEKDAERATKRVAEMEMWHAWKKAGEHPDKLVPLLSSLQPIIQHHVNIYAGHVPIPTAAIEAEVTKHVIKGLHTYDPDRGAQLSTWLHSQARGVRRFVTANQNLARIPEERSYRIGDYDRAYSHLSEQLDRAPTAHEIADNMKVPVKQVQKLANERHKNLIASLASSEDPFIEETPRSREVLRLIEYELTPTELQVFEHLTGRNGKNKTKSTSEIARRLGWNDSKVSQVKDAISKKIHPYLYG